MKTMKLICNKYYQKGIVDPRLFGSLAEHMGRVIYSGIYEPESAFSDEDGFRKDVIKAVREAGITTIRYPGGNFVSTYHWEDGVGPKDKRPTCLDLAWKAVESNAFGTDEFIRWTEKTGTQPLMAINLGTRGVEDAIHYLEYCNSKGGTRYSDLRIANGRRDPYNIRMWCLGNEMDGEWQIGHKTACDYGKLAAETSKAMKIIDPSIETILCGSSLKTMKTYPLWEAEALDQAYNYIDYISLHQYFGGQELGTEKFLSQADEMDDYIQTVRAVCQYIKAKKRSNKDVKISFDEWGVWTKASSETVKETDENRWQKAPAISEMIYSCEDALLYAGMLMAIMRHPEDVKIACQALTANVSSMIMTDKKGGLWLQPTYYPFTALSHFGRGIVMDTRTNEDEHVLDTLTVYNVNNREVTVFAVNRSVNEDFDLQIDLQDFHPAGVVQHQVMKSSDKKADNRRNHNLVVPETCNNTLLKGGLVLSRIPALSWNVIRIRV